MDLFTIILTALGLIAGAWLQAYFGIFQDRRSRKEEKKELKNKMKESLLTAIDHNEKLLAKGWEKKGNYDHIAFWHILKSDSFENAISPDNYFMFSLHAQNKLSDYYDKIKHLNKLVRQLDGEQENAKIIKINYEQRPIMHDLKIISTEFKTILETE